MLRNALLYLAGSRGLYNIATKQPFARRLALRFVAGERMDDAIRVVGDLNSRCIQATIDHLGENVTDLAEAASAAQEYIRLDDRIAATGLRANVSLKLTQMGLNLDEDICLANLEAVVKHAASHQGFVRVDMEASAYTQRTLDVVKRLHERYPGAIGAVIQAYLYRSAVDIEDLISLGIRVRLCKGAYDEPASIAYRRNPEVREHFRRLGEQLMLRGNYPALATHDEVLIDWARQLARQNRIPPSCYEFQMLYGMRRRRQTELVQAGHNVRVYVPYGSQWYPYLMRRLAERPANVILVLSNLLAD